MCKLFITEILQFKNEHGLSNGPTPDQEESVLSLGKSEPIMVDRNQYSMGESHVAFNHNNDDAIPEVEDHGYEIRYFATYIHLYFFWSLNPARQRLFI